MIHQQAPQCLPGSMPLLPGQIERNAAGQIITAGFD
jgi:hypothetical protein